MCQSGKFHLFLSWKLCDLLIQTNKPLTHPWIILRCKKAFPFILEVFYIVFIFLMGISIFFIFWSVCVSFTNYFTILYKDIENGKTWSIVDLLPDWLFSTPPSPTSLIKIFLSFIIYTIKFECVIKIRWINCSLWNYFEDKRCYGDNFSSSQVVTSIKYAC